MSALDARAITLGLFDSTNTPGLLRIWGGEGERNSGQQDDEVDDDVDDDNEVDDDEVDDDEQDDDEDDEDEDKSKSKKSKKKDGEKSLEEQLDDERRARLKAEKALNRQKKANENAEADADAAKDRDKYKAKLEARDKFLADNLLLMEISKQSKYKFIDPEDVVTFLQSKKYSEDYEIDLEADTPTVDGLDLALKRLAKEKPHLLKKSKDDDDDDEDDEPRGRRPSGGKIGNGKKGSQEAEDRRLAEKFKLPGFGAQAARPM